MDSVKGFFEAVASGDVIRVMKYHEDHAVDINSANDSGSTALHAAVLAGNKELVEYLVDEGADLDRKDSSGEAPINVAASSLKTDIVKYLLIKGSKYKQDVAGLLNDDVVEALFVAVDSGNEAEVTKALAAGAAVDSPDKSRYQRTPLHFAASAGNESLVKLLVEGHKADVNIYDEFGELPLHNAADAGHLGIVKYLLSKNSLHAEDVMRLLEEK